MTDANQTTAGEAPCRGLPADERAVLYEHTLANLQTVCAIADLALDDYCRELARIQVGRRGQ